MLQVVEHGQPSSRRRWLKVHQQAPHMTHSNYALSAWLLADHCSRRATLASTRGDVHGSTLSEIPTNTSHEVTSLLNTRKSFTTFQKEPHVTEHLEKRNVGFGLWVDHKKTKTLSSTVDQVEARAHDRRTTAYWLCVLGTKSCFELNCRWGPSSTSGLKN